MISSTRPLVSRPPDPLRCRTLNLYTHYGHKNRVNTEDSEFPMTPGKPSFLILYPHHCWAPQLPPSPVSLALPNLSEISPRQIYPNSMGFILGALLCSISQYMLPWLPLQLVWVANKSARSPCLNQTYNTVIFFLQGIGWIHQGQRKIYSYCSQDFHIWKPSHKAQIVILYIVGGAVWGFFFFIDSRCGITLCGLVMPSFGVTLDYDWGLTLRDHSWQAPSWGN